MEQIVERVMRNKHTNRTTTPDKRTTEEIRFATGEGRKTSKEKTQTREK